MSDLEHRNVYVGINGLEVVFLQSFAEKKHFVGMLKAWHDVPL